MIILDITRISLYIVKSINLFPHHFSSLAHESLKVCFTWGIQILPSIGHDVLKIILAKINFKFSFFRIFEFIFLLIPIPYKSFIVAIFSDLVLMNPS